MFGLIAGIIGLIALGCLVAYAIVLTIKWIRNKVAEKLAKKNDKKVAVADLEDEGYTHMMVEVGHDGNVVGDVEVIKDKNDTIDKDVEELLSRTNQGMVIVER